eukprot:CAMPEP_0116876358 /NCGR_PEP_ID=MMETSP0463-20121206/8314_1 /TAXON_ID=181622 /ORGANISM="Strombidinopsis sp, Strain SopsisLIS2011" /LENGTH=59 /DNA_ID=CAMNT_0004522911 /DNA_START=231 /DNA_END=410 /DNA_ORIENTATION=+
MNINFEKGPFTDELGPIPDGKIRKKFIWGHGIHPDTLKVAKDAEGGDDAAEEEAADDEE